MVFTFSMTNTFETVLLPFEESGYDEEEYPQEDEDNTCQNRNGSKNPPESLQAVGCRESPGGRGHSSDYHERKKDRHLTFPDLRR